jgi:hypothetical protein
MELGDIEGMLKFWSNGVLTIGEMRIKNSIKVHISPVSFLI